MPLFTRIPDRRISVLMNSIATIELPGYSVIYLQDEDTDGAYIVKSGLVKTTKLMHTGKECTLELFFPGEAFGLRALFGLKKRPSNALTLENSKLLFLPQREIESLGPDLITLRINVFDIMDERLRKLEDRFSDLANRSLRERLAVLLVKLSSKRTLEGGKEWDKGAVLPLSQLEVANLIGSTRESVSATLNQFKREGILSLKRRHIRIENIKELMEIAQLQHNY